MISTAPCCPGNIIKVIYNRKKKRIKIQAWAEKFIV